MMFCSPAPILSVSIHAPWEGCDRIILQILLQTHMFQFTHPRKGATFHGRSKNALRRFQFTHPGKGATSQGGQSYTFSSVSIHAPWEGCDVVEGGRFPSIKVSIHAPWEGCDLSNTLIEETQGLFQFTHPGKGATVAIHLSRLLIPVSIHAPWEGCDRLVGRTTLLRQGFNSRTLGRVRLSVLSWGKPRIQFQFTHPGKGATSCRSVCKIGSLSFNSRTPGGVRL